MSEAHLRPSPSASTTLEGAARRRMVVRAVTASAVGTTVEWYDFFLYGVAAATVFPQTFFPQSDPFIGTLLSFSTYFVGFVARPMGAAIFGHYGDRVGRKALLVITMMMMGVATVGIGLVPSYATIGIWGAVILTVLRLIQGLSIGGEWSGSVLMAGEWTDPKRRGFTTSFAQFGAPAGMVLANGALALMTLTTTEEQFLAWGWRLPFLASIVLVFVGLYIRLGILETPVFAKLKARGAVAKAPVVEVLRKNWREVVLTALLRTGQQVPFYIFTTYIITYATQQLGYSRSTILNFVIIQSLISTATIPLMGHLSDIYGRRTITAIGCVVDDGVPVHLLQRCSTAGRSSGCSSRSRSRCRSTTCSTGRRRRSSRRASPVPCATAGRRSATNWRRSRLAVRPRSSLCYCSASTAPRWRSPCTCRSARWPA